jgi:hypothetical protein
MKTTKLNGYFDVRKYAKNVERTKRALYGENETITFGVSFAPNELPAELKEFALEYTNKNGEPRVAVQFKISRNCKWYDGNNLPLPKPLENGTYSPLEGKRCKVQAYCSVLHGDPSKRQATGLWADAVKVTFDTDECPFGAPVLSADSLPSVTPAPSEIPQEPAQVPFPEGEKEMPF